MPAQRPPRRRGVVLIFVVAVLVLLAVISTTYLSMTRVDRVAPEIRGGVVIADNVPDPTAELRLDLFSYALVDVDNENNWRYRPADNSTGSNYGNYDFLDEGGLYFNEMTTAADFRQRQFHDPWLAAREPVAISATEFAWPKISRWLERWSSDSDWVFNNRLSGPANPNHIGFFESPLGTAGTPDTWTTLANVIPTYVRIDLPTTFNTPAAYAGKAVIYPAFTFPAGGPDAGKVVIAGDADGDGVADSGLFPLDTWLTGTTPLRPDGVIVAGTYPLDPLNHSTRWYAAVRIVDNNAAINVNTAWRRNFDWALNAAEPKSAYDTSADATPNYGFFRSNIGLYELLPSATHPLASTNPPFIDQWTELFKYRFNEPNATRYNTGRTDYVFSTVGEALEMNLGRRPLRPGPDATPGGAGLKTYRAFGPTLSANLAYLNGLINPSDGRSDFDTALIFDAYQLVPNWGAADGATAADKPGLDTEKQSRSYTFFVPPDTVNGDTGTARPELWWHSLYNLDNTSKTAYFTGIGAYSGPFAGNPPRTVRQVLTSSNPLATTARVALTDSLSPAWLTNMIGPAKVSMEAFKQNTKAKVGINTSTFGELWRNFFLSMKDPNSATLQGAVPADLKNVGRVGGTTLTSDEDVLYLRSAIAAVNAVDMRDGDDDFTTRRIALPGGENVMVAGAEAQLFITRAEVVANSGTGRDDLQVDLYNPYADQLITTGYKIGFFEPTTGTFTQTIALPAAPVLSKAVATVTFDIDPAVGVNTQLRHLVLLRTRLANGTPTNVTTDLRNPIAEGTTGALVDSELVCVDMVEMLSPLTGLATGAKYERDKTNWKLASAGKDFVTWNDATFVRENPVAVPNRPSGVLPANQPTNNRFPLSGFPRDGDMMMVPYVGHYTFYNGAGASATVKDVVPVTVDVQRVPVPTSVQNGEGYITGRFIPAPTPDPAGPPGIDRRSHDWRSRIFDNFTTLANPMSDAFPNIEKDSWLTGVAGKVDPQVVTDVDTTTVDEKAPVHGFVNVNTASESVLSMVPFFTNTNGVIDSAATATTNLDVARKLIAYRRINGPYRSIVDVADALNDTTSTAPVAGYPPTPWADKQGNLYASTNVVTPLPAAYAGKLQGFVRVSNLVTTRSDSFTIYVLLQQWQDFGYPVGGAGGRFPLLIPGTEKRFALTVDRSQLIEGNAGEDMIRRQSVAAD